MGAVKSVARALTILEAVAEAPASLSDLARRVDLPISTTSRLLATLEESGAVERIDEQSSYRIGPKILAMASAGDSGTTLAAVAHSDLEALALEVGEAVGLGVLAGHTVHYMSQIETAHSVQVRDWVGHTVPLHLVSSGYALMGFWSDAAIDAYLDAPLIASTPASVTDPDQIRDRIDSVRATGICWTVEEFVEGITSVAAPVYNASGEAVAAVHVHGPSYRFSPGQERVEAALKRVAESISLAYSPQRPEARKAS